MGVSQSPGAPQLGDPSPSSPRAHQRGLDGQVQQRAVSLERMAINVIVCSCVRGCFGCDAWGEHSCHGNPAGCHISRPAAVSGGHGLCVSHSSTGAHHTAPSPTCMALGKLLTSLYWRFLFCKTRLVLGLWEGFEETVKGPGVLSVLASLCPQSFWKHEGWHLGSGEGTFDPRNWNHHQKRRLKELENLKPGECCLLRTLHESNHCFL